MKKLSLLVVVLGILFITNNTAQAQGYKNAIGIRFAWDAGITFKHFFNEKAAIEIIASRRGYTDFNYTRITGLYLIHNPITSAEGLSWYYGGGATAFFWGGDAFDSKYSSTVFGLMGALGLEYKFSGAPIALSIDWLPGFFFSDGYISGLSADYGALAARYTF